MRYLALIGGIIFLALNSSHAVATTPKMFDKWAVICGATRPDIEKKCYLHQQIPGLPKEASLDIFRPIKKSDELYLAFLSQTLHRRKSVYLRIDNHEMHIAKDTDPRTSEGVRFQNTHAIISEMKQGTYMFVHFTDKVNSTHTLNVDLRGFNDAFNYFMSVQD